MALKDPGEQEISSQGFTFSGTVFIYHDDSLSLQQMAELERTYSEAKLTLRLRGQDYRQAEFLRGRK